MSDSPTRASFWNTRYESGRTPWDAGGVPAALGRHLAAHPGGGARVLIPGCGSGHEIDAFRAAGYAVTAVDFSPVAAARARAIAGPAGADCIVEGDFFTHDFSAAPFDVVYERTFLCALPPEWWPKIARRTAELLKPGGAWIGVFCFGPKDDGPPYGLDPDEPARLFDPFFHLVADNAVPGAESLPLFAGQERWQERRRRGAGSGEKGAGTGHSGVHQGGPRCLAEQRTPAPCRSSSGISRIVAVEILVVGPALVAVPL